ncbi:MAG: hypothetical protein JSV62_16125, partial [Promethearchaeota archaeon]
DQQDKTEQDQDPQKVLSYFKLGNVFDISQTTEYESYLKEQQEIDKVIMKNAEVDYKVALDFTKTHFPELTIKEDFKQQETKGTYSPDLKEIVLYEKSSHSIFHELGHHITITVLSIGFKEYSKNEILAEISSYLLTSRFDENIEYNFKYSNVWSYRIIESFTIEEFEQCFKKLNTYINNLFSK